MTPERSIKATLFQVVADDVARLLASGRFTQAELERRLDPSDLRYLGKQLAVSSWVPLATFVRVMNAALDLAGITDREAFMRAGGAVTAARLRESGIYRQFEVMNEPWSRRVGKILSTLGAVHYNFTRWSFEEGEGDVVFRVEASDAADLPEMLRIATEGYIAHLWSSHADQGEIVVTSKRVTRDKLVFTATRKQ